MSEFALRFVSPLRAQRNLAGAAGWSFLAAVLTRGANLAALVICARVLEQSQFGQVAIIQSTVGMFAPIAGLGLAMTTTKLIAQYRDSDPLRAGRIIALCLCAAAAAGLFMTVALIALAPTLAAKGIASPGIDRQLMGASGLLLFGVIEAVQTGALTGLDAFPRIARLSVWNGLLSIPLIAWLAYSFGASGAIAGLTASIAGSCVMNWIALSAECRKWGITPTLVGCSAERGMLVSFSLPSYLSGIAIAPVTWLNSVLLVNQPDGFSSIALFTAADRFRYLLVFAPLAVSRIAVPALSRYRSAGDSEGFERAFRWNMGFGMAATIPPVLVCIAMSQPLMGMFGESFRSGWPVLVILAVSAIPTVVNTQLGAALLSNGHAWPRAGADLLLAVVFLLAAQVAVPLWNATGLAASFAIAYAVACVALWISLKTFKQQVREG